MNSSEDAEERWRRILLEDPENAEALRELGQLVGGRGFVLQQRGELDAAAECYEEAVALDPTFAKAHNNLGNVYRAIGRPQDALHAYRAAVEADASLAEAHLNLGVSLYQAGAVDEAADCYREAFRLDGKLAEASLNLGYLLDERGDWRGAMEAYRAAMMSRPDFAEARFNHALQLLQSGDYAQGWEGYEWRLKLPEFAPYWPHAGKPRWDGSDPRGKRILLYAEQGFGDAIQFVRYAPLIAARGAEVLLRCSPKLMELFRSIEGVASVHSVDEPVPEFDLCCSIMSLPHVFRTTLETIPAAVPYLRAPREKTEYWKGKLSAAGAGRKVGLFWSTESENRISRMRSLTLEALAPLASARRTTFYSLQRGAAAAEVAKPPAGLNVVDAASEMKDFGDDAALIASLDLVISINTATMHLAGALGRPVWALVQYPPDWRWLRDRDDTPWYPTMRLFRRGPDESWAPVVARVARALCL